MPMGAYERALYERHVERHRKFFPPVLVRRQPWPQRIVLVELNYQYSFPMDMPHHTAPRLERRPSFLLLPAYQAAAHPPTLRVIVRFVALQMGVTPGDILTDGRDQKVCWPRQIAMHFGRKICRLSFPALGHHFKRDHTTVLSGHRKVLHRRERDPAFDRMLRDWECYLTAERGEVME